MLVCVREFDKAELSAQHGNATAAQHFERYYSLYTTERSVTIVDVADSRARKTLNYDVRTRSSTQLHDEVVEPLLATVLTPDRASQAVVVIDGQPWHRRYTLLDPVEGILARAVRAAVAHPNVTSVSVSATTLEDNNTLTDIMAERSSGAAYEQPTILEDTHEQFTSVEDANYVVLDSEATWDSVLSRITATFAGFKHEVISFIFAFHESTGLPNTTMQFISFTVNEVARGMKSSRHAVASAAALVECRSPTVTFTATKLLYLLKPALLGQQPGAWVACFSPVSLLEAKEQETFQEAFAVAQTASRLYSSRIALLNPFTLPPDGGRAAAIAGVSGVCGRGVESAPPPGMEDGAAHNAAALLRATFKEVPEHFVAASSRGASANPAHGYPASQHHLVDTPAATHGRATESASDLPAASSATSLVDASRGAKENCAVQTPPEAHTALAPRESIQRGASEERSAVRYELDTYRLVMERAMGRLRAEMRECAGELRGAREDVRRQAAKSLELQSALDAMRASYDAAVRENDGLRRELRAQQCSESATAVEQVRQDARQGSDHTERVLRSDVAILEARVEELTELVALHQSEIEAHVANERRYRQRILDLECELREKERAAIADKAAVTEARRAADVARAAADAAPGLSHVSRTSSAIAEEDLRVVRERATEVEYRLRDALDALQSERTQRLHLENLMKHREEEEEVARAAPQHAGNLLQSLQNTYETQLRELKTEMSCFRTDLAQYLTKPSVRQNLGDASSYTATPVGRDGRNDAAAVESQRLTPPRMSPIPSASATHFSHAHDDASALSHGGHTTALSPSQQRRQRRTLSFEEFMQEEPHYKLHRASFLRRRPRPPVA
ncbi:hypothetical protein GH5_04231 [Leishmania sp. Ghana 2012 LV757]|uniref:hypothetical protein n=1 Tax=Leishmania sp. Ghana 2012 LV757 TaxID=2803181 RepID=UPI001B669350|nr:hypothetical protein GH5_04231 [Leishmania sp. Ghana 2012 LV757]